MSNEKKSLETILNDSYLQQLYAEREKIYLLATPLTVLGEGGKAKTVWIDESNHPLLYKINDLIERRIKQLEGGEG